MAEYSATAGVIEDFGIVERQPTVIPIESLIHVQYRKGSSSQLVSR